MKRYPTRSQPWVPGIVGCQVQDSTVLSWTYRVWINNDTNVVKTIINHPQTHHFYGWYTPFPVMGSLWHCFNHISLMAVALAMTLLDSSYILAATWTSTLMGSKVKNFQMPLFIKSKTRPISHTNQSYHITTCSHIAQTYVSPKRWLNMTFINSPHGSHVGTEFFRAISPCSMRLLIFQGVWHWMQAQAVGDFWLSRFFVWGDIWLSRLGLLGWTPVIFMEPYSSHWNKQGELTYESDSWVVSPTTWILSNREWYKLQEGDP